MNDQTNTDMTSDVLDKLAKELSLQPAGDERVISKRGPTDMERLMDASARLLKSKIEERIKAVSDYERHRVELMDGYRVQMERLRIEAEDAVRHLVANHDKRMAQLNSIVAKLEALRGS